MTHLSVYLSPDLEKIPNPLGTFDWWSKSFCIFLAENKEHIKKESLIFSINIQKEFVLPEAEKCL